MFQAREDGKRTGAAADNDNMRFNFFVVLHTQYILLDSDRPKTVIPSDSEESRHSTTHIHMKFFAPLRMTKVYFWQFSDGLIRSEYPIQFRLSKIPNNTHILTVAGSCAGNHPRG